MAPRRRERSCGRQGRTGRSGTACDRRWVPVLHRSVTAVACRSAVLGEVHEVAPGVRSAGCSLPGGRGAPGRSATSRSRPRSSGRGVCGPPGSTQCPEPKPTARGKPPTRARPRSRSPPDLAAALAREPSASTMFDGLSRSDRYTVLYRVTTARRPDTRRRRIEEFVAMLARGGAPHAQRGAALGTRPPGARAGRAEEAEGPTAPAGGGRSAPGAR